MNGSRRKAFALIMDSDAQCLGNDYKSNNPMYSSQEEITSSLYIDDSSSKCSNRHDSRQVDSSYHDDSQQDCLTKTSPSIASRKELVAPSRTHKTMTSSSSSSSLMTEYKMASGATTNPSSACKQFENGKHQRADSNSRNGTERLSGAVVGGGDGGESSERCTSTSVQMKEKEKRLKRNKPFPPAVTVPSSGWRTNILSQNSNSSSYSLSSSLFILLFLFTTIPVILHAAESNPASSINNKSSSSSSSSLSSSAAALSVASSSSSSSSSSSLVSPSPLDSVSPASSSFLSRTSNDLPPPSLPLPKSPPLLPTASALSSQSTNQGEETQKPTSNDNNSKPSIVPPPSSSSYSSSSSSLLSPTKPKNPSPSPAPNSFRLQRDSPQPLTKPSPQPPPTTPKIKFPTTIKLGLIVDYTQHYNVFPAVVIAKETVLNDSTLLPGVKSIQINIRDSQCSLTYGPLAAVDLYAKNLADIFLGPVCSYPMNNIAKYCNRWNIPVVTPGASEKSFNNKTEYTVLTRMEAAYTKVSPVFKTIFNIFGWNHRGFIVDDDGRGTSTFYQIGWAMFQDFKRTSKVLPVQRALNFKADRNGTEMEATLKIITKQCNIIVLCASPDSVREIMIKAHELNFDNGEYVFFSIDLFSSNDATSQPWLRVDDSKERNDKARKAYEALMIVTLRKPTSEKYRNFSKQVKKRAKTMYSDMVYSEQEVNSFVGAFHDAVILYAYALNETISAGGNVSDGLNITRRMWNRTIEGITGTVSIDENGDRNADYSLLDLNPEKNEFVVVADYLGNKKEYQVVEGRTIHWAGGREGPPPDKPKCGFDGSLCPPSEPFPEYVIVIIVLGTILVIILIIILIAWRHIKLESELAEQNWRVKWEDIMIAGTTKSKKMEQNRRGSYGSNCSVDTIAAHLNDGGNRQLFTKTGYYKGAILAIKPIYRTHFALQKSILMEIKKMKDLQNDHLVRFQGICIDLPHQCMLTEYCPKGSLQDVLENDQIKLDWMFRYSIMQDIVRGMAYLHSTDIKSHGHLKSSNCVVDSRFVVKITDFGLLYFREREEEIEEITYAKQRSLLWTAPELLRMAEPPAAGTQKADMYSFAIICQEIVYRKGVFFLQNLDLSPQEITEKVRNGHRNPCRPTMEEFDCPEDELAGLIRRCWSEEPSERPDFQNLRTLIKRMNKEGDKGDILDNLLSRMEQYATNLEALVDERTSDYLHEKKKAEELLYNMLPKQVASRLIQGNTISAEWYDEVTIYFSDICGFTALSAASTPMEVVDLLNDLYTCFDSILENFDVYKVETIGDAYMVVSGLPGKNGNLHAREIARMSLCLLDNVFRFKIRHRPEDQLKLRIGMHTGPVCAGVVGLKMPRYCLFGDTVNTSSRMESNGLPLRIHVSPFTKEILDHFGSFNLECRGEVEMKGKGSVKTYWLLGEQGSKYNIRQQGYNEPSPPAYEDIGKK